MRIDPAIRTLRDGGAQALPHPQRSRAYAVQAHMAAAQRDWLESQPAQLTDDFRAYADGAELRDLPCLSRLMMRPCEARNLVASLNTAMLAALRHEPLGEVPFRFKMSTGLATLQILHCSRAVLSLAVYEPVRGPVEAPDTAVFVDREQTEIVVSGRAAGVRHTFEPGSPVKTERCDWAAGDWMTLTPGAETRQVLSVKSALVMLQLTRDPERPKPSREVLLATGHEAQRASGDKAASQALMATAVLGALGATNALDVLAETALARAEEPDLRWEAVRQSLSLDAAAGKALLDKLAARADDPLAQPASALRAHLFAEAA
ncbi:MAG: hypothetical protein AAF127_15265 [Pseudomonadota bacterium]